MADDAAPISVGIAGLGRSGWNLHVAALRRHPGYHIAAVCDPRADRRQEARAVLGCAAYAGLPALLEHPGIELIVIATPTREHAPMARAALGTGRHVVLEKPLAASVEEAEPLRQEADRAGRLLCPYYNYRFSHDFLAIRALVERDLIGRPFLVGRRMTYFNRRDDWQSSRADAGGILSAATVHFLDQALQLVPGKPMEMWSDVRRVVSKGDAADHSKILIRFADCVIDVEVSWAETLPGPDWLVHGPRGTIRSTGQVIEAKWFAEADVEAGPPADRAYLSGERIQWREEHHQVAAGFSSDYYDQLAAAIRKGSQPPVTWDSAMATFRLLEQASA